MSKCLKGIPFYNDKVKDAAQQFAINKGLDEEAKKQATAKGKLKRNYLKERDGKFAPGEWALRDAQAIEGLYKPYKHLEQEIVRREDLRGDAAVQRWFRSLREKVATGEMTDAQRKDILQERIKGKNKKPSKSNEPVIKQLMPAINQAMSQVTREMGLPLPKEVGNTTAEQRKKDPGIYASMSKDKLSFDVPNINIKYGNELKKTLALAEQNTNKINRYLAGEKMTKPAYNLFAGLYSTKELQILAHLYHEMGHHLVNYYKNPYNKVSTLKKIIKGIDPEQDAPKTRSIRASKNADEWFAENFSYWAMNKYQGEAPIGPPRTVLDVRFMQLIRQILDKSL